MERFFGGKFFFFNVPRCDIQKKVGKNNVFLRFFHGSVIDRHVPQTQQIFEANGMEMGQERRFLRLQKIGSTTPPTPGCQW